MSAGADGIYDIDLDTPNRDALKTAGLESAILVSLFSDRRAAADEVADPLRRRGWICDLVSAIPGDRHGSGLWLYAQSRLTETTAASVAAEARNALDWLIQEGLCNSVACSVTRDDATRTAYLIVTLGLIEGGVSQHAFVIANATRSGLLT